jgi:hypothetical protein
MSFIKKIDLLGKNINEIFDKRKGLIVACIIFVVLFISALMNRWFEIYNDGLGYYIYSAEFMVDGKFALTNYHNDLRGYIWPLLVLPIRLIAQFTGRNHVAIFRVIFALLSAGFFGILTPKGVERIFKIKINFLQRLLFAACVLALWSPTFLQPLSDMLSFMLNLIGIYLIYYASSEKKTFKKYLLIILSGMALASTSLIRPVYQFSLYLGIILLIILNLKKGSRKNIILIVPFIIGAIIIFAPQFIINVKHFGIYTPYAQAQNTLDGRLINQMSLGIVSSGSFGYIGEQEIALRTILKGNLELIEVMARGPYQCFVSNTHGLTLLEKMGGGRFESYGDYIIKFLKYPFDFIAVWMTHLFYGLDLNFPRIHYFEIKPAGVLYSFLNYTIIFFAAKALIVKGWFKEGGINKTISFIILIVPCLVALMVNMEERFMLPLHMIIYMLLAFNPNIKEVFSKKIKINFGMILVYLIFIMLCFTLSAILLAEIGFALQQ